jgi:hypothetical protein
MLRKHNLSNGEIASQIFYSKITKHDVFSYQTSVRCFLAALAAFLLA